VKRTAENLSLLAEGPASHRRETVNKALSNGARIAVVGAGPAGSMFSYFLLDMARNVGLDVNVDIYEPRHFCHRGPAGCNHCGGIVSESLVQLLATEGILLPDDIVQRGIESYTLHTDVGDVAISTPLHEKRIAAIYRGNGPRNSEQIDTHSFDGYLLQLAQQNGAHVIRRLVTDVRREGERLQVFDADRHSQEYELVVIASGVNSRLCEVLQGQTWQVRRPERTKTFICEFYLGRDVIQETFGPSMHVFLLNIPRLKFAALIPKGDYVTLCLLGRDIDDELMAKFFASEEVRRCFPEGEIPAHACHCYPRINVKSANPAYADRLVMIGDSGATRLFKDGIGASYRTAKAAARTVVFHGISREDFANYYAPLCRKIERDNQVGKIVFAFGSLVQKARFARRGVLRMTSREQGRDGPRPMSGILWDLFSGSAPYTDVFLRTLHPSYVVNLVWNLLAGTLSRQQGIGSYREKAEGEHVRH